jgi:anti-sigma factor RsiW
MNNQEAKLILQAYRPGGQDAHEPLFREALEQAQRDPELNRWFATEQALEARLSARLKSSLVPPPHLKSTLLAQRKIVRPPAFWQRPVWRLAAAACLALVVGVAVVLFRSVSPADAFARYQHAMADFVVHKLDRLDLTTRDVAAVRQWLAQQGAPSDLRLPAGQEGRPSLGCRLLE